MGDVGPSRYRHSFLLFQGSVLEPAPISIPGVLGRSLGGDTWLVLCRGPHLKVGGEYQAKDDSMIQYLAVAQLLIKKFKSCKLTQIPREQN
ncbi:hypothetical protein F2Q70_00021514 [Brassica cretica]|uniref:Uncharacterized protein n=1 Tax=Brassica cretica TaxID=69181 RepID=A0A8S9GY44_BRACR|nr:hypothetical protein F2Q70_00021514 [Brassica cretica]